MAKTAVRRQIRRTHGTVNLAFQRGAQGYRHLDKDPVLNEVAYYIEESGLSIKEIAEESGVSVSTIQNWMFGTTKRPQRITIEFVLRACGYRLIIVPAKKGK